MSGTPPTGDALPPNSDEYRGDTFKAVIIVLTIVTAGAMILRFVSRSINTTGNRFWWDDWFALFAFPFIMAQMGVCFAMLNYGLGHHIWAVLPPTKLTTFFRLLYSIYFVYDIALALTKTSALLFLSRIFPKRQSAAWFNYAIYTTHALNAAWLIGIIFGTIFQCNPVEKGWNPALPEGKCGSTNALWLGSAVPSVVIDLIILILPLPRIWGLQMSGAKKSGITLVFLLGYLVIIVSLGRLITVLKTSEEVNSDPTYEIIPMSLWVTAEAPVTTVCICLPAMLPLGRHLVSAYLSPLASKISSTWSRGDNGSSLRSKSGNFTSATDSNSYGMKMRSAKMSNPSTSDEESLHSASNSMRGILPRSDQYSARVRVGEPMPYGVAQTTDQAIHVEKAYTVARRGEEP